MAEVISIDVKPVREMPGVILGRLTSFTDQKGIRRSFRTYQCMEQYGVTDIKGDKVILSARFPFVEINSYYECFIVGNGEHSTVKRGWEAFDLEGHPMFNGQRFKTRSALYQALDVTTQDFFRLSEVPDNYDYLDAVEIYHKDPIFTRIKNFFVSFFRRLFKKS